MAGGRGGRREDALREAVSGPGLPAGARAALPVVTDVTEPGSVAGLFETVRGRWGRVDLLVNNAGIFGPGGAVDEISVQDWRRAVDTNLTGAFLCAQQAVGLMKAQQPRGGRIINNGSLSAHVPRPMAPLYRHQARHYRADQVPVARRPGVRHRLRPDRYRECRHRDDRADGTGRAAGQRLGSPGAPFGAEHVAEAVLYMAGLPLDANVLFLTITATTMPFIGRG